MRLFFCINVLMFCSMVQAQLIHSEVAAILTDSTIDLDFTAGDTVRHQIFLDQSVTKKNKLLLFLPGTGARPGEHYTEFLKLGAQEGYHSLGLVYKNTISISGVCGTNATTDTLCSEKARSEIIYGTDLSNEVQVDSSNAILNRLKKVLMHLNNTAPTFGWDNFIDPQGNILWQNIAIAGHSQGGGHAALLARDHLLYRVLFFNSPSDQNANIQTPLNQPSWFYDARLTSDSSYYAFYHEQNGGPGRLDVYQLFGLTNFGSEINVDITSSPFSYTHVLMTDSNTFDHASYTNPGCNGAGYDPHSDIIIDCELPLDQSGNHPFESAWRHMLNNQVSIPVFVKSEMEITDKLLVYPNPFKSEVFIDSKLNLGQCDFKLYDLSGRLLEQFQVSQQVDLSHLASGTYIYQVWSEKPISKGVLIKN
ncbi:MAG: T9SS type A sorting domain-containing protein [Flavobacteriales bacterium]|nr:T9SS type A sorting domain-containing protein [Flavobacteriales bacterium]